MQIAVLANPGSWYAQDLERAITARGHGFVQLDFTNLTAALLPDEFRFLSAETSLRKFDALIVRTMPPGSLEEVIFRMNVLGEVAHTGMPILNPPRSLECAVDKYLTSARLARGGVPVPRTIVCETTEAAMEAFELLGGDVVIKPLFGSEGRGIVRVSDPDLAFRSFRTLERLQSVLYLQEFITHPGYDLRVMVLDDRVIGGMKRISPHDFRTNVARQATPESYTPTALEEEWALRSVALTEARIAGVDILYDRLGRGYVLEVNAVPGWKAFQRTTGTDVAALIVKAIERA